MNSFIDNNQVWFRFYEELNDFLPENKRKITFQVEYTGRQSVKDLIESQGVPHTEIDLVLLNSQPVNFEYIIEPGDSISVYPVFESLNISEINKLWEKPLRQPRFIADVNLGKLAKYLRMVGFDTLYSNAFTDKEIVNISNCEQRIILTRDIGILKINDVKRGYFVRSQIPKEQVKEIINKYDLNNLIKAFSICIECNGKIEYAAKNEIIERLLPKTIEFYNEFQICSGCNRIFWKGSHYKRMLKIIDEIKKVENR